MQKQNPPASTQTMGFSPLGDSKVLKPAYLAVLPMLILVLASLACYSDSPLWFGDALTPTPQMATPIPAAPVELTQFQVGEMGWVPVAINEAGFQLNLTIYPEPLRPDLTNKARQSCSQNTPLEILFAGISADETIYYLIDCLGAVGWTTEGQILGPINILPGDRALTTEAGVNETGQFKIDTSDPPYSSSGFRQQADCKVNDTVDVIAISGFSAGELYYKIRCTNPLNPVAPNVGWAVRENLFGPVRFRNNEIGIVPEDVPEISLMDAPEGETIIATCESDQLVSITNQPVQRIEDALYYQIECEGEIGWVNQESLLGPVPYTPGSLALVVAPRGAPQATPPAIEVTPVTTPVATTEATESFEDTPHVGIGLTENPEPLLPDNQIGQCPDAALATVEDYAGIEDTLYAQITCGDVTGWLDVKQLYGPALYSIGTTVQLGEKAVIGFSQRGIFLSIDIFDIQGPSGGSSVIAGECAYNFDTQEPIEAVLTDVGYYRDSLGNIVGVFYKAQCTAHDGSTIEGWLSQRRIGA